MFLYPVDGPWSTAPNTPTQQPKTATANSGPTHHEERPSSSADSATSYEKAILTSDALGGWHTGAGNATATAGKADSNNAVGRDHLGHVIPRHIESPVSHGSPPAQPTHPWAPRIPEISSTDASSSSGAPGKKLHGPDIVTSSPTHVRVGFYPAASIEATNPADLPGSRSDAKVITTPPHSASSASHGHPTSSSPSPRGHVGDIALGSRPRAESIEDADRRLENYVPMSAKKALDFSDTQDDDAPPNAFCLDFSSLIGSTQTQERQPQLSHQIRIIGSKKDYTDSSKRPSLTASDISTISVSRNHTPIVIASCKDLYISKVHVPIMYWVNMGMHSLVPRPCSREVAWYQPFAYAQQFTENGQ